MSNHFLKRLPLFRTLSRWSWVCLGLISLWTWGQPAMPEDLELPDEVGLLDESDLPEDVERRISIFSHYAIARTHQLRGEPWKAAAHFLDAAWEGIEHEALVVTAVSRYFELEDYQTILPLLKAATEVPGASARLWLLRGHAHHQEFEWDAALDCFDRAKEVDPKSWHPISRLMVVLGETVKFKEAWIELLRFRDQGDHAPEIHLAILEQMNRFGTDGTLPRKVVDVELGLSLQAALNSVPKDLESLFYLARLAGLAESIQRFDLAIKAFEILSELHPEQDEVSENLVRLYLTTEQSQSAFEILQRLVDKQPQQTAWLRILGQLAIELERWEDARGIFEKLLQVEPDRKELRVPLAQVYLTLETPQKAVDLLREDSIQSGILGFQSQYLLGIGHAQLEEFTEACEAFKRADAIGEGLERHPASYFFYFQWASFYEKAGEWERCVAPLKKAIEMNPEEPEALNFLGYLWADHNVHLEEALELIQKALEIEPDSAAYLDSLGWVLYRLQRYPEALEAQNKAVALAEMPDPVLWDHLGDIYFALGEKSLAVESWRKALELEESQEILKKINQVHP